MSVEREAFIGFGYIISGEEHKEMLECAGDNICEVEDEFWQINSWGGDGTCFLGEIFYTADEDSYICLDNIIPPATFDPEIFSRKMEEILTICGRDITPTSKWAEPKVYLVSRVF